MTAPDVRHPRRRRKLIGAALACTVVAGLLASGPAAPLAAAGSTAAAMALAPNAGVVNLKVNANPAALGIDDPTPTLTWALDSDARGLMQTRYRLVVATTAAKAATGKPDVWDTGIVTSDETSVDYAGPALQPRTRYHWSVQAWTPQATGWSSASYFETAYLDESQWQGSWISGKARSTAPVVAAEGTGDDACCLPTTILTTEASAIGATNLKLANVLGLTLGQELSVGSGADQENVAVAGIGTATLPATTTVAGSAVGDTKVSVSQNFGFAADRQVLIGVGPDQEPATVAATGTAQGAATTLWAPAVAGATNIKVNSVAGFVAGEPASVGAGGTAEIRTVTAVGTQARATTLINGSTVGNTNIKVVSITGLAVGNVISVDGETATISFLGTAGANTTLSVASEVGATNVKPASVNGYTVGQQVRVGTEVRTVTAVGTAGVAGTGITLNTPLTLANAVGAVVTRFGTGIDLAAPLTAAHATAAPVTFAGTGITFGTGLTNAQPVAAPTRGLGSGITFTAPLTKAHAAGDPITSLGTGITVTPALTKAHPVGTAVLTTPTDVCRPVGNSQNAGQCKPVRPNYLLRKNFTVAPVSEHGAVVSARLYSTGLGWSEPSVNGALTQPDGHLNPGFTDYQDTVQYTTDDVTALIEQKATVATANVVASEVAAGRYNSESVPSNHRFETAQWRNQETLRADLYIRYADGTEQLVKSDNSWKVSTEGPTRYADYDNGETYDARRQIPTWNLVFHNTSGWDSARTIPGPQGDLVAMGQEATKVTKDVAGPFSSYTTAAGARVFDVKRQYAGWATFKVWDAQPGQVIRFVFVERRNDDLTIDDPTVPGTGQDGALQLAGSLQQHYYVSDGTGTAANPEVFAPNWNFAGFQWIQVDGSNGTLLPSTVKVDVDSVQQIRTAQDEVGTFESSVPLLNQIHTNVKATIEGNWIAGFSSDTPTYEKDGWTGDAQIILPTVANIFDIQRSMKKSAQDSVDSQLDNGQVGLLIPGAEGYGYCSPSDVSTPDVFVPCGSTPSLNVFKSAGGGATPIWDAFLMVTSSEAYLRYNDISPIETAYGAMKKYMDVNLQGGKPYAQGPGGWFVRDGSNDWTLNSGLGDWAFVTGADGNAAEGTNLNVGGFQAASSTAFTAFLATRTAEAARALYAKTGDAQYLADAGKYETLFDNIRHDFNARWWDAARGFYAEDPTQALRQGFQAWAIGFGLVEEENKRALQEKLAYDVAVTRTGHAMIGFVGIRWIWPVLSDAAHDGVPYAKEALFAVAQQTTYPSYGYHIGLGYTGIGEYWEASTRTRNHQFQGSIGQWFYEELAGIQPASPGYKEIRIRPLIGSEYGVDEVSATYRSIHGEIAAGWQDRGEDGLTLTVTVPPNTTADVHVPGSEPARVFESGSGTETLAAEAPGVELVGPEADAVVYRVGSGSYTFTVKPAEQVLTNTTAPAISGTATVGATLTVSDGSWSAEPTGFSYRWLRDGVAINGATTADYDVVAADLGKELSAEVTATLAGFTPATAVAAAVGPVVKGAYDNTAAPTISGTAKVGSTLTVSDGSWTPVPTTVKFQWLRDGLVVGSVIGNSYPLTAADADKEIAVKVTVSGTGFESASIVTAAVGPVAKGTIANTVAPSISGTAKVGFTLTLAKGSWAPSPTSYAYQWLRNGVAIAGATGGTYKVAAADVGKKVSAKVTAKLAGYTDAAKTSAATAAVAKGTITTTVAPKITGTTKVGSTLTALRGTWTPAPTAYSYQWLRNGAAIIKATGKTYKLVAADKGKKISVKVTAKRTGYTDLTKTSAAVGPIK